MPRRALVNQKDLDLDLEWVWFVVLVLQERHPKFSRSQASPLALPVVFQASRQPLRPHPLSRKNSSTRYPSQTYGLCSSPAKNIIHVEKVAGAVDAAPAVAKNSVPSRAEEFESYKRGKGAEINRILNENKSIFLPARSTILTP